MIRGVITLALLVLSVSASIADAIKIDSLKRLLTSVQDTSKVNVLLELAQEFEYIDRNTAKDFAIQGLEISKAINYEKGETRSNYELAIISFINCDRNETNIE